VADIKPDSNIVQMDQVRAENCMRELQKILASYQCVIVPVIQIDPISGIGGGWRVQTNGSPLIGGK